MQLSSLSKLSQKFLLYPANRIRTKLGRYGVFLPVSRRRWELAQVAEEHSWPLPLDWDYSGDVLPKLMLDEQTKARFIVSQGEEILGLSLRSLVEDKTVIDVACGPCSIISNWDNCKEKIGIDPAKFPSWVHKRYQEHNFELVSSTLEGAVVKSITGPPPVVVMYNALQHFQDINGAVKNLKKIAKNHELFFVDYAEIPADAAHPQILTEKRLRRILLRNGYRAIRLETVEARLPGLVETGSGQSAKIICGYAQMVNGD